MISRKMNHDMANKMNEILGTTTRPLYFVSFPISRNTSLPSCTANTTDPIRAKLQIQTWNLKLRQWNWQRTNESPYLIFDHSQRNQSRKWKHSNAIWRIELNMICPKKRRDESGHMHDRKMLKRSMIPQEILLGKVRNCNQSQRCDMVCHANNKIWTSCFPKNERKNTVQVESASKSIQNLQLEPASSL